ncbi:MAG TPA: TonB-dependent receptor [Bryobacteraceae bacterium]|nr:TonB-dependent receptor [Bryobacteraceae bacterium]
MFVRPTLLVLCGCLVSLAEPPTGVISGTVTDAQQAVIAGAEVSIRNANTNAEQRTTTNDAGLYRVLVSPGEYRVEVAAKGFRSAKSVPLVVTVGSSVRFDVELGLTGEQVTLEVAARLAQTDTSFASTVVSQQAIQELPLNGRQLQNLALLAPGVTAGWNLSTAANRYGKARENTEGAFAVNGIRSRSNNFVLDGMPMNVRQYSVINFEPSNEAVQEFALQTGALPAEYGRTMGATVNIVTRSGSTEWRASLYEFFRNDRLDSNNTFNTRAGLPRGKVRQNQFGGTLGGPIWGKKHFVFAGTEILRNIEASESRLTSVPTADERRGLLSYVDEAGVSRVLDLSGRITPLSRRLVELYPAPNTSGTLNYNAPLTIALNDWQWHLRTDHILTERDTVTVRVSRNLNDQEYVINRFGGPFIPGFSLPNPERTTNGTIGYVHTFSAAILNEARVGINRYANDLANGDQRSAVEIGLPNGNNANGIPSITFSAGGLEMLGGQSWFNREQNETTWFASDSLNVLQGRHNYKFGGEVSRYSFNTRGASNQRGTVTFDGSKNDVLPKSAANARVNALADLLLGLPQQASIVIGDFGRGYRQWAWALFAQDTWRASPRLTLNYGLRYEYGSPWTETHHKLSNFVPGAGLIDANSRQWDGLYRPDRNNFAPRLGVSYDVSGSGRTVLRGGFGVLYETLLQASTVQPVENNAPFSAAAVTFTPTPFSRTDAPSTTLLDLRSSAQPSRSLSAVATDLRNPYTVQWSFDVQHVFGDAWVVEIGYRGTRGLRLPLNYDFNQVPIEFGATSRPYPAFNAITLFDNAAQSTYHGLQTKLERRFRAGLGLLAAYTWSKSIDNASDFSSGDASETVLNSYDWRRQRGPSSFDVPHRFTAAFSYDLPKSRYAGWLLNGWQTNGIVTVQSGQPFTPFSSVFDPVRGESYNRLVVVGDPRRNVPSGLAYNPAAFALPGVGVFGNSGRNVVRGDRFRTVDFSLFRNIRVTERMRLQVRGEAINLFNTVNYQGPVVNQATTPGAFVAAAAPRQVQLGAKFSF